MSPIRKAVIPAAGLGTRFLPATKAMPKEMLPVVDKPAIQYVVEEAVAAGMPHILMVTGRNKTALENHFDRAYELESVLEIKGETSKLNLVNAVDELADIHFVRQGDPLGLGHAVLKAEQFVGNEPFAVLLGDEIIAAQEILLQEMAEIAYASGANVVALSPVPDSEISRYGVAQITAQQDQIVEISGFVEKPQLADAPSNLAIIGRYVLQPEIFDVLRKTAPGKNGEIQLTDALNAMAQNPELAGPVVGVVFTGRSFDTGDKLSYIKAIVELALERDDLGPELRDWLDARKD